MVMIIKKALVSLAFILCAAFSGLSQTKSINLELLGSSGLAGVNFDSRFAGNSGFGYSVGLGYGYSQGGVDLPETKGNDSVSHEAGIPIEVNYLFGDGNSHFVLGAGAYAGIHINEAQSKPQFAYTVFGDIAYRYQKPTGFSFAAGLKPNLRQVLWPYIAIGYSF